MVIFWNFAGVPFVSCPNLLCAQILCLILEQDVLLLDCVHGYTRSGQVSILNAWIYLPIRESVDCLLHVSAVKSKDVHLLTRHLAGILQWRKRVDSRCRRKERSSSAIPSLNYHGERSRTLVSSRQRMGTRAFQRFTTRFSSILLEIVC